MRGDDHPEYGVAEEFEPLVRLLAGVFGDKRAMNEREMHQLGIDREPEPLGKSDGRDRRSARDQGGPRSLR